MGDFRQDFRYGMRMLARAPGFAIISIVTLALGIGANVGMFSVIDSVLLRPLPVANPARLGVVSAKEIKSQSPVGASWTKFQQVQAQNSVFEGMAAFVAREFTFSDGVNPEQVHGARVSAGFFGVLGVRLILGRDFQFADDVESSAPTAVLSYGFWQRQMGSDHGAVGRVLRIEGRDTVIVGVLPNNFKFQFADREPQIYLSSVFTPGALTSAQIHMGAGFLQYIARLKPGVTFSQAQSELDTINARYRQEYATYVDSTKYDLQLLPLAEELAGDLRPPLLLLMATVILVLLIACANVAHLLLARASARQREIAIRLALGASRTRLVRQLLTESLVLALLGCVGALAFAEASIRFLVAHGPTNIPRLRESGIDIEALIFAVVVACATAVLFGMAPAFKASRMQVNEAVKEGRSGGLISGSRSKLQQVLASSETAIAMTLLIAAGLIIQSLARMEAVNPGFNPHHVLAAHIALPRQKYPDPLKDEVFFTRLLEKLKAQPGINAVGAISYLPMSGSNYGFFFYVEGSPNPSDRPAVISVRHVSEDYFTAMSIPLRAGRFFSEQDNADAVPVAIINETAARRYFGGENAVGRRLASSGDHVLRQIVGVVSDVRFDGPAKSGQDELYLPHRQVPWASMTTVISSGLETEQIVAILRREVSSLDPDQPVAEVRSMDSIVAGSMAQQRFTASLLGVFTLLALAMSCFGLYGVIAFFVTQRTREFGIRMALGAVPNDVLRLVMGQGFRILFSGICIGIFGALTAGKLLARLLFGIGAYEVGTYMVASLLLGTVGFVACYFPAMRATRVDPMQALRYE